MDPDRLFSARLTAQTVSLQQKRVATQDLGSDDRPAIATVGC